MTERPILFSGPMVCALLDGRKTQTRRPVRSAPLFDPSGFRAAWMSAVSPGAAIFADAPGRQASLGVEVKCPYGVPGDLLWVREAWTKVPATAYRMSEGVQQTVNPSDPHEAAIYAAGWVRSIPKWRPSIHMPRWASRITLRITDVRVERLQDISHEDCWAEGVVCPIHGARKHTSCSGLTQGYRNVWETINGPGSWDANPWVWAVSFERVLSSEAPPLGSEPPCDEGNFPPADPKSPPPASQSVDGGEG